MAPSQTFAEAFSPPRMHLITVYRKSNWVKPKPNAPMLAIMAPFKAVLDQKDATAIRAYLIKRANEDKAAVGSASTK